MAEPKPKEGRRAALTTLVTVGSVAYAAALALPALRLFTATAGDDRARGPRWIRVARLDELTEGTPRRVQVVGDEKDSFTVTRDQVLGSVWIVREGEQVRALSATCPHLGCAIDLGEDKTSFACPCHTSKFSAAGEALAGPSPRGMDPLATRIVDGAVEVDFRRFRQGVTEREEVGA